MREETETQGEKGLGIGSEMSLGCLAFDIGCELLLYSIIAAVLIEHAQSVNTDLGD